MTLEVNHEGMLQHALDEARNTAKPMRLESLLCNQWGFGLTTASPLQRAICRIADGVDLMRGGVDLRDHPHVIDAVGDLSTLPSEPPAELYLLSGVRTGKSMFAAALAVRATQTCNLSQLGPGEVPRVSVVSLKMDLAKVIWGHIVGAIIHGGWPLQRLLIGEPTSDTIVLRHPSGRPVEIRVVAGSRAGASLVARWSAGAIFDEAPRMVGASDGVVNFEDERRAVLGRLLPGAQLVAIGSPWAPFGPIYDVVQEYWGKPSRDVVVIRAAAPRMNPVWWTKARVRDMRMRDPLAYKTDVMGEFADPEAAMYDSDQLERSKRSSQLVLGPQERHHYVAAMDPGTRANAWTLVVATLAWRGPEDDRSLRHVIVLAKQWQGSVDKPLNPEVVLEEIALILGTYGLQRCASDQYAADAISALARRHELYIADEAITARSKVDMFESLRVLVANGEVELPPEPVLIEDLKRVRKKITQAGISIDLPHTADGRHCDYAPALALCLKQPMRPPDPEVKDPFEGWADGERAMLERTERDIERQQEEEDPDDDPYDYDDGDGWQF